MLSSFVDDRIIYQWNSIGTFVVSFSFSLKYFTEAYFRGADEISRAR